MLEIYKSIIYIFFVFIFKQEIFTYSFTKYYENVEIIFSQCIKLTLINCFFFLDDVRGNVTERKNECILLSNGLNCQVYTEGLFYTIGLLKPLMGLANNNQAHITNNYKMHH